MLSGSEASLPRQDAQILRFAQDDMELLSYFGLCVPDAPT
jgi:hypothetical protein